MCKNNNVIDLDAIRSRKQEIVNQISALQEEHKHLREIEQIALQNMQRSKTS